MSNVEKVNCSFCGKNKQDTNILIAGHSAHICYLCIQQAHEIVKEDLVSEKSIIDEFKLLKPKKIKAYLDDFVIGQNDVKKSSLLLFIIIIREYFMWKMIKIV